MRTPQGKEIIYFNSVYARDIIGGDKFFDDEIDRICKEHRAINRKAVESSADLILGCKVKNALSSSSSTRRIGMRTKTKSTVETAPSEVKVDDGSVVSASGAPGTTKITTTTSEVLESPYTPLIDENEKLRAFLDPNYDLTEGEDYLGVTHKMIKNLTVSKQNIINKTMFLVFCKRLTK